MEEPIEDGIEWSVPVLARRDGNGKLIVEIPDAAAERLDLDEGDVVCYTAFANGGIEFWSVKKSPYTSLEDDETAARLMTEEPKP
ncbi:MAG: hypothetical protein HQ514_00695 [Rhodospirillales bacterium]|nr:hypothetical protein [Rhodospirillales bacterium]